MSTLPSVTGGSTGHVAHHNKIHTKLNAYIDVIADYGATGNGSTNDTTAIQNAINDATTTGGAGSVYFPPGKSFLITQPIQWKRGVRLFSDGQGKTTNPTSKPAIWWGGSAGATMLQVENVGDNLYNTPIHGLEIDGRQIAATGINYPNEVDNGSWISDMVIRQLTGNGIEFDGGCTNGTLIGDTRFDHIGGYAFEITLAVSSVLLLDNLEYDNGLSSGTPGGFVRINGVGLNHHLAMHIGKSRVEINKQLGGNKACIEYAHDNSYTSGTQVYLSTVAVDVVGPSSADDFAFFRPTVANDNAWALTCINSSLGFFSSDTFRNVQATPARNTTHLFPILVKASGDVISMDTQINVQNLEVGRAAVGNGGTHGNGVMLMANATTAPTATPSGVGALYVEAGALKYRGPAGTVTVIANS